MTGQRVDLRQRLHHEAGVKVVDEVAHAIHRVGPGAIGVLRFQHEVQVAFRDCPVVLAAEHARGAGQQNAR